MKALGKTYEEIDAQTKAILNLHIDSRKAKEWKGDAVPVKLPGGFITEHRDGWKSVVADVELKEPKYHLPAPKPLRVGQYAEHHGGRPFLDARVSRGWWIWKRFEDVAIFRSGAK